MIEAITFGPFRLLPVQRVLFENDRPLRLGSRALDILIALADSAGEVFSKDDLVTRVWPKTFVEEEAGDGVSGSRYIVTVPGRGYRFVAPVKRLDEESWSAEPSAEAEQTHDLPAPLARIVGRKGDPCYACNCEQSRRRLPCHDAIMNTELTNANERASSAHQRLGLQRVRLRTLRATGRDTNRAEAVFRTMRQAMEASEVDRFQIEAELMMARTGAWS